MPHQRPGRHLRKVCSKITLQRQLHERLPPVVEMLLFRARAARKELIICQPYFSLIPWGGLPCTFTACSTALAIGAGIGKAFAANFHCETSTPSLQSRDSAGAWTSSAEGGRSKCWITSFDLWRAARFTPEERANPAISAASAGHAANLYLRKPQRCSLA
jgi:hypothetical protein